MEFFFLKLSNPFKHCKTDYLLQESVQFSINETVGVSMNEKWWGFYDEQSTIFNFLLNFKSKKGLNGV